MQIETLEPRTAPQVPDTSSTLEELRMLLRQIIAWGNDEPLPADDAELRESKGGAIDDIDVLTFLIEAAAKYGLPAPPAQQWTEEENKGMRAPGSTPFCLKQIAAYISQQRLVYIPPPKW